MQFKQKSKLFISLLLFFLVMFYASYPPIQADVDSETSMCLESSFRNEGILTIWHDDHSLYVEYNMENIQEPELSGIWAIAETRLVMGFISTRHLNQAKSDPFSFKERHDPPIRRVTYIFDLEEWAIQPEAIFYVAAQAELISAEQEKMNWSDDSARGPCVLDWATYLNYCIKPDERRLNDPGAPTWVKR